MGKCENCGCSLSIFIGTWGVVPRTGGRQEIVPLYLSSNLNSNFHFLTFASFILNTKEFLTF